MFPRRLLIHIGKRRGIVIRKDQPPEQGKENKYEKNDRTRKRLFVGIDHGAERPEALPQADKKVPAALSGFINFSFTASPLSDARIEQPAQDVLPQDWRL